MRQLLSWLFAFWLTTAPAFAADNAVIVTPGSGVTMRSKDVGSGVQSMVQIPGDTAGTPLATAPGTPNGSFALPVQGVSGGTAVPISAASLPLPTGAATAAGLTTINTTLGSPFQAGGSIGNSSFAVTQATSSNLKGQVDPLTIGTWGIVVSTQNSTTPTNGHLVEGQFNTSPTTITNGNVSPLQLDNAGNLLVNVKAGGGSGGTSSTFSAAFPGTGTAVGMSQGGNMVALTGTSGNLNVNIAAGGGTGGTALADQAAFTQATTNETPIACLFTNSYSTITSGHAGVVACTNVGSMHVTVDNANNDGRAAATSSSPVVSAPNLSTAGAIAPNNTTAVVVKGSAGVLFGVQLGGIGSSPAYLKIYNAATATCGSGTPIKRLIIPASSTAANGAGSNVTFGAGLNMGTGITYCLTAGIADNDTTAPAASNFLVNIDYE